VAAPKKTDKPKPENPLVLKAEVVGGNWMHRKIGRISKISKSLVTVEWDNGMTEYFGRQGQAFHGRIDENGEAIRFTSFGKPIENIWGGEDEPGIEIATEGAKARIEEERTKKEPSKQERETKQKEIESDLAYQKRQADLKRYSEMLSGLGANIVNGWNNQSDFRIELDGIKPDKMDRLIAAIQEALK
jgi:hypothetical protein